MELTMLLLLLLLAALKLTNAGWPDRIARRPDNVLTDFNAYRHISVIHFDVPENLVSVAFKFTAKEVWIGGIGTECDSRDVSINLKAGSLPLVRPDDSKIAAKLLDEHTRPRNYSLEILSNGDEHLVNIVAPPPGDWYAIAYRSYQDPDDGKIKQQGLGASCDTVLDAELSVEKPGLLLLSMAGERHLQLSRIGNDAVDSAIVQFHVPKAVERARLRVTSTCAAECVLYVHVTASTGHLLGKLLRNVTQVWLKFRPQEASLHYVTLRLEAGSTTNLSLLLEAESARSSLTEVSLVRKSLPDFFLFDYEHLGGPSNGTSSKPSAFNVTAGKPRVIRFRVGPTYDVGGTLSVGLRVADEQISNVSTKVVVVGCLSLGRVSRVSSRGRCGEEIEDDVNAADDDDDDDNDEDSDDAIKQAKVGFKGRPCDLITMNKSSPGFVHAPFPEPGIWQLTTRAFCLEDDCPCFETCATSSNSSELTNCTEGCNCFEECEFATLETSISSSPCVDGGCNEHGRCQHYMSGGFVYSGCYCISGWRGFDCADDSKVVGRCQILTQLLALTLSNLAFVGAVYVAIRRGHYTESLVYAAVCFFSTFYHACEAGEESHSFCLLKLSVLQFCDFYNALLSIWVTLVAMASLGSRTTGFCQILGALLLAFGAEMDRTALWVFLLPTISGCALIIACWAFKCRRKGSLQYPTKVYRLVYLPIGLIVVFVGLVCYAFLQTRRNYYIVHSLWHICVAVGVVLLLPKKHYML